MKILLLHAGDCADCDGEGVRYSGDIYGVGVRLSGSVGVRSSECETCHGTGNARHLCDYCSDDTASTCSPCHEQQDIVMCASCLTDPDNHCCGWPHAKETP
jgi:hypothetical protein